MDSEPRQRRGGSAWQGFTFLGGSSVRPSDRVPDRGDEAINEPPVDGAGSEGREQSSSLPSKDASFPLSQARPGDRLLISAIAADEGMLDRFLGMGLSRGTELEVTGRGAGGSMMVAVANTRLGLGAGMAEKIRVRRSTIPAIPSSQNPSDLSLQHSTQEKSMQTQTHLRDLAVGSQGRITGYDQGSASYRQKLLAMGLTPGTEFTVTRHAPLGDPVELQVRGFQLSLRKAEADALIVESLTGD